MQIFNVFFSTLNWTTVSEWLNRVLALQLWTIFHGLFFLFNFRNFRFTKLTQSVVQLICLQIISSVRAKPS